MLNFRRQYSGILEELKQTDAELMKTKERIISSKVYVQYIAILLSSLNYRWPYYEWLFHRYLPAVQKIWPGLFSSFSIRHIF